VAGKYLAPWVSVFKTRGRFQQGSGKIGWARRPGCATVIFNGITKAPDLVQHIRPLIGRLNSIFEGDVFSGLKADTHGAFINDWILGVWQKMGGISVAAFGRKLPHTSFEISERLTIP
jgi:hypothetical protein